MNINDIESILNQNLWLNSHIKINKKVVVYRKWMKKGIKWISDILMENNAGEKRFMTEQELTEKLGFKPMFLIYNGLLNAIPSKWREKNHQQL